tara:strand:- start:4241 stop:7648 length:3408 start_codon:yes stop_codon:yes gene_type:complete
MSKMPMLLRRRFGPIFAVQFLGAFNDNLLKFALLFLATFVGAEGGWDPAMLAIVVTGLFVAPYFPLSAIAGQMADAGDKARIVRNLKLAEVGIMVVAAFGAFAASVPVLLACILAMGVQSAFFGPVKYAILPQHLRDNELVSGTGMVEAGTFVAILGGQLAAGIMHPVDAVAAGLALAVLGAIAARFVPAAPPSASGLAINWNPVSATAKIVREAMGTKGVWLAILGISWFFAAGAVVVAQFVPLVAGPLSGASGVATLFLIIFSVFVAIGSVTVSRLLKGDVSARYVPWSALGLAFSLIGLWLFSSSFNPSVSQASVGQFLSNAGSWPVLVCLAGVAFSGGMFVVPLYAILQTTTDPAVRSRTIAANNIVNAAVSVLVLAVVGTLVAIGTPVTGVIGTIGFATLAVAAISCWLLPEVLFKAAIRAMLKLLFRVEVHGAANMPGKGEKAVVVVNHVSWLDGLLLAAFLPGKPTFAVNTHVAAKWWMKPALKLFDAFPVDPTNPMAAKAMVKAVREGRTLVIFPEGRITTTGALMKVFDGPGMVADKADAPLVPVRISGAQFSKLSRLKGKVRRRWFPQIELTVLEPRRFETGEEGQSARERRAVAGRRLYDEMSGMIFSTSGAPVTLFEALRDAGDIHGVGTKILEDVQRQPLTYSKLVAGSFALGRKITAGTKEGEAVGVLLPNVSAVVVTFFGLQAFGRVPAMLNFTAGRAGMEAACTAAAIRRVVTSKAFVEQAKLEEVVSALEDMGIVFVWLEDVKEEIGLGDKLRALAEAKIRGLSGRLHSRRPEDPAVILFTSGSEGVPKGVALSHENLVANCRQLASRIAFDSSDIVMNALPVFHSFGLTGGTLLPILFGIKTVLYPSPLHYRQVAAFSYDANATILFGTDTFLSGYARVAHPYDFYAMRYVFAGAEKVRDETRKVWGDKFGLRILEGYGATECAPVIAVNTPMHFRAGSVGRMLPGMEARLDDVPGIEEGGRLSVRGPNVMAGYMKVDRPGELQPPEDGWHDTGDIVTIDEEGFVTIRGRAKRFAKIGGEMVSLPAVEANAARIWPEAEHAVVTRKDPRKGEALVLFTTSREVDGKAFGAWARDNGVTELSVPKDIRLVDEIPVLGTGKRDYVKMGTMAEMLETAAA